MKQKYQAVGAHIFVIRDTPNEEQDGMLIPDLAKKKPNTGLIHSVGEAIADSKIKVGEVAIFSKTVGTEIVFDDMSITVLRDDQILGIV